MNQTYMIDIISDLFVSSTLFQDIKLSVDVAENTSSPAYCISTLPCTPLLKRYVSGDMYQYQFCIRGVYANDQENIHLAHEFFEDLQMWIQNVKLESTQVIKPQTLEIMKSMYFEEVKEDKAYYKLECRMIYTRRNKYVTVRNT